MKKLAMIFAALTVMVAMPHSDISAQKFLKKVGKAIEKGAKAVDKALDDVSGSGKESSPGVSSGSKSQKVIVPYETENTKIIYVDDIWPLNLYITPSLDEGVFWVEERKGGTYLYDTLGNRLDFDYGKRGFITVSNTVTEAPVFRDGVAPFNCILEPKGVDLLDKNGNVVAHLDKVYPRTQFNNMGIAAGYIRYDQRGNSNAFNLNKYDVVYYNTQGEIVLKNISMEILNDPYVEVKIRNMYNNRMAFMDYGTRKWGFIDENYDIVVPAKYSAVLDYSDGVAAVKDASGNWGFIDKEGNTLIGHIYSNQPGSFRDGYAWVQKRSGSSPYAFVDKKGNIVMDEINSVGWRIGGYSCIYKRGESEMETLILDKDLKVVHKGSAASGVKFLSNNMWFTDKGAFDMYGNPLILGCVTPFTNGLALMMYRPDMADEPKRGFMRPNGEIAILFAEREF